MDKILTAVLNGDPDNPKTPSKWSNGRASVEYVYRDDMWNWKTPEGSGFTDVAQVVLKHIRPYL